VYSWARKRSHVLWVSGLLYEIEASSQLHAPAGFPWQKDVQWTWWRVNSFLPEINPWSPSLLKSHVTSWSVNSNLRSWLWRSIGNRKMLETGWYFCRNGFGLHGHSSRPQSAVCNLLWSCSVDIRQSVGKYHYDRKHAMDLRVCRPGTSQQQWPLGVGQKGRVGPYTPSGWRGKQAAQRKLANGLSSGAEVESWARRRRIKNTWRGWVTPTQSRLGSSRRNFAARVLPQSYAFQVLVTQAAVIISHAHYMNVVCTKPQQS
jgi:hypothetical protein